MENQCNDIAGNIESLFRKTMAESHGRLFSEVFEGAHMDLMEYAAYVQHHFSDVPAIINFITRPIPAFHRRNDFIMGQCEENLLRIVYSMHTVFSRVGLAYEAYFQLHDFVPAHEDHIDLINNDRRIAMEVKASNESDSGCAKAAKMAHLAAYKQAHPNFEVIYGCVNEKKSPDDAGTDKMVVVNGQQIRVMTGVRFMNYILQNVAQWQQDFQQIAAAVRIFTNQFMPPPPRPANNNSSSSSSGNSNIQPGV